ncbi:MAG: AbrB/MazE/SpoVT family DNA-binding domain-containing protein [Burkholderiales bacterium]
METAKLTSNGRIVIPKRIRDAVRAKPGTEFSVRLEGSRIILDAPRSKDRNVSDWTGLNPWGVRLTASVLCQPVSLGREDDRG